MAVSIAHDLTRVGAFTAAAECFAAIAPGGPFTEVCRDYAAAAGKGNAEALASCALRFGELGADLFEAEAYASAASAADRAGRNRDGHRLRALAGEAAGRCEGLTRLPFATTGAHRPPGLSRREQEVVRLAAARRTNREIADELMLSERTVENHLYRAFGKLGVTTRAELAAVLSTDVAIG